MRYRYWDACAFLGWLREEPDKIDECRAGVRHGEQGEVTLVTSAFTLAEVLYLKGKDPIPSSDRQKCAGSSRTTTSSCTALTAP